MSDRDAERLFAGGNVPDPEDALTRFTADVRAVFTSGPSPVTRALHLEAMTAARTAVGDAAVTAPPASRRPRRRRIAARVGVATAALVLVGGSAMAATGTLPDAAQDAVSSVARRLGVTIPRANPRVQLPRVPLDIERPTLDVIDEDAKDRRRSAEADDDEASDSDSDDTATLRTVRDDRDDRRRRDEPSTVVPTTPDRPASDPDADDDDGPIDGDGDGRGDPTGDGGGDGPDDGTDGDGDGDGGSDSDSRGDPIDGSPAGADAGDDGAGTADRGDAVPGS